MENAVDERTVGCTLQLIAAVRKVGAAYSILDSVCCAMLWLFRWRAIERG